MRTTTYVCRNIVLVAMILTAFLFKHRGSPIPGPSYTCRNSPIHIPSDSESEHGWKPLIRHKRRCYVYDSSTESESSIPPAKHSAIYSKEAVKMLKDIKCAMDKYHEEARRFRLWRELDEQKSALVFAFACLICKDVVSPDNTPVVPPCCRAAVMCKECLVGESAIMSTLQGTIDDR